MPVTARKRSRANSAEVQARYVVLLRKALEKSGMTSREFARAVLLRDERTMRRWLAGDRPIPTLIMAWLDSKPE